MLDILVRVSHFRERMPIVERMAAGHQDLVVERHPIALPVGHASLRLWLNQWKAITSVEVAE